MSSGKARSCKRTDIAIIRIEQLYPFRGDLLQEELKKFPKDVQVVWTQEEPANMGAWPFLRIELALLLGREPLYIGRPAAAAPATGSHRVHGEEQKKIIEKAFLEQYQNSESEENGELYGNKSPFCR